MLVEQKLLQGLGSTDYSKYCTGRSGTNVVRGTTNNVTRIDRESVRPKPTSVGVDSQAQTAGFGNIIGYLKNPLVLTLLGGGFVVTQLMRKKKKKKKK